MDGLFISVEGNDGSGKSTQIKMIEKYLEMKGKNCVTTREPGGTQISEKIRELLLSKENGNMCAKTEMLLYAAARAQHVEEFITPMLKSGVNVITDRFTDSSIAYQAYGRELGLDVTYVNYVATGGLKPKITFFLDLPPNVGIERKLKDGKHKIDRIEIEKLEFHKRVYEGYKTMCSECPIRVCCIDANQTPEEIFNVIKEKLDLIFEF